MRACLLALALVAPLAGCATTGAFIEQTGDQAAEAADLRFDTAQRVYCDGQTTGALRRKLGHDPEALAAYLQACGWKTWPEARGGR